MQIDLYDCEANSKEVEKEYGIKLIENLTEKYDAILLAVSHKKFKTLNIESLKTDSSSVVYDLKGFLPREQVTTRL